MYQNGILAEVSIHAVLCDLAVKLWNKKCVFLASFWGWYGIE